jgi:hypothetical protein
LALGRDVLAVLYDVLRRAVARDGSPAKVFLAD